MKFSKNLFYVATCGVAALGLSISANAQVTGHAYIYSGSTNATPANFSTAAGSSVGGYTFSLGSNSINFQAGDTTVPTYTGRAFVNSGGGTITSSTVPFGADALMSLGSYNTIIDIKGTTTIAHGQAINTFHDDGIQLYIGGNLVLDAQGQTSPEHSDTTFGGVSGTYNFDLYYDECCSAPAVLTASLPTATPEPTSIVLMATMLLGVGIVYRRNRKNA